MMREPLSGRSRFGSGTSPGRSPATPSHSLCYGRYGRWWAHGEGRAKPFRRQNSQGTARSSEGACGLSPPTTQCAAGRHVWHGHP